MSAARKLVIAEPQLSPEESALVDALVEFFLADFAADPVFYANDPPPIATAELKRSPRRS